MLEELREILKDDRNPIFLALVTDVDEGEDAGLIVSLRALPEGHRLLAEVSWTPGAYEKPRTGDMALVVLASQNGFGSEHAYIVNFLPRSQSGLLIPKRALDGQLVVAARAGQKLSIGSGTRINIGKGGETEESEPLVLGNVLKSFMAEVLTHINTLSTEVGKLATQTKTALDAIKSGPITAPGTNAGPTLPALATALANPILAIGTAGSNAEAVKTAIDKATSGTKAKYLTETGTNILSQIAFTERGAPE